MRGHRCVGVSQQSPLLFRPNSNHFSIETIASRNRGQTQTGQCPAGKRRDAVNRRDLGKQETQTHKYLNTTDTFQPWLWVKDTHTNTHQRPLQFCWGAWEGGQQSDYSPDLWTGQTSSHQRGSDPPELQSDPNAAPLCLDCTLKHTHTGRKRHSFRVQNCTSESQVLPWCCVKRERKQAGVSLYDLWKLRFTSGPDRAVSEGQKWWCGENRRFQVVSRRMTAGFLKVHISSGGS